MGICCYAFDQHWILFPSMWHLLRLSQGRTQERPKCALGWLQKLTHVPLAIAILLEVLVYFCIYSDGCDLSPRKNTPVQCPSYVKLPSHKLTPNSCSFVIAIVWAIKFSASIQLAALFEICFPCEIILKFATTSFTVFLLQLGMGFVYQLLR